MIQETEELLDEMGVNIDATELAGHLDTGKNNSWRSQRRCIPKQN